MQAAVQRVVQQPVVVVADVLADDALPAEVERRALDRPVPQRDAGGVGLGVAAGVQRQPVAQRRAGGRAAQVEVGMRGQVDDGGPVAHGLVGDAPALVGAQRVAHRHVERTPEAHLAVGAGPLQQQADAAVRRTRLRRGTPQRRAEALRAAMQAVRAVVGDQRVRLPVQHEARAGNAVGIAPGDDAQVRARTGQIGRQVRQAQHHVRAAAGRVRRPQAGDDAAPVQRRQHQAAAVVQPVLAHRAAIRQQAIGARRDGRLGAQRTAPRAFTYSA